MRCTTLRAEALPTSAALHLAHLDLGLFPHLGPRFLRRYHASFARSPHAVALATTEGDEVTGFLVGTTDNEAHYRWTVRHEGPGLALAALIAMLTRPRTAWWFLRTRGLRYVRGLRRLLRSRRIVRAAGPAPAPTAPSADETAPGGTPVAAGAGPPRRPRVAVLTHVAVDPRSRGRGVGRALTEGFLDAAWAAGADEARLITATDEAARFYERTGWRRARTRTDGDGTVVAEFRRPHPEVR